MKRRLTEQQNRRIQSAKDKLTRDVFNPEFLGEEQLGQVTSHWGNAVEVYADGRFFRCHVRQTVDSVVVGDAVVFRPVTEGHVDLAVIVARKDRHSLLARPDVYKKQKDVVANIDQMLITMAIYPELVPYFLDKYLVAARLQKITPVIVLNKADLLTPELFPVAVSLLQRYRNLGYPALLVSSSQNLNELRALIEGKLSVFVGPSGVGKSALINALLGTASAEVGEMSMANQKGCHTTTRSNLYPLAFSAGKIHSGIVDSPGIREFGLWNISAKEAAAGFVEFEGYLGRCKFRDCSHQDTPGCALDLGVKEKKITPERLESFYRLLREIRGG